MNWISNNLSESLIMAGLALLVIEVVILGFSTFVLFFVGLAALIAGEAKYEPCLHRAPECKQMEAFLLLLFVVQYCALSNF